MPVLPSGRRIEFSLDRFHALLGRLHPEQALAIANALRDPDDLLPVLDTVNFSSQSGAPFFADYVAADWEVCAMDWNPTDREALRQWFASDSARHYRAEAIEHIKAQVQQWVIKPQPACGDNQHTTLSTSNANETANLRRQAARIASHHRDDFSITAETGGFSVYFEKSLPMARWLH